MVEEAGVKLITVEQAFGERPFMVTTPDNPYNVQVRGVEELWLKENLINLGISRAKQIDPLAREVAWVDADCHPVRPAIRWFEETWHALQHYEFVQMWEWLINYGPEYEPVSGKQMGFMATYAHYGFEVPEEKNLSANPNGYGRLALGRPGLAWAANISALNQVGGLIDRCILGSGDWHMAHALVGAVKQFPGEYKKLSAFGEHLLEWQTKCERWIKRDVGFVKGTVSHWFHGDKKDRQYGSRSKILVSNGYNPLTDVKYDSQGVLQLETWEPRQIKLRDQIRAYMASRNEDSITVY